MNSHDTLVQHLANYLSDTLARMPTAAPAQIITTHISSVILAGDYAYKLKRPVRLPFLDYSSLAQRQAACQEEWRINQRTAPDLYLDVKPIFGTPQQPVLGDCPEEQAIEWMVVMRRFQSQHLLSALARQGRLRHEHILALAEHVATFHAHCQVLSAIDTKHDPPTHAWLLDSLKEIATLNDEPQTRQAISVWRDWFNANTQRIQSLHQTRLQQGLIRDCHGDMHLGNLTLFKGKVVAFDAIDFNPALRHIDLIDEAAFVFMDLLAHHLPELAWQFLNHYLHQSGDYTGLPLLEYYVRYRAIVRAKVACLSASGRDTFHTYRALASEPSLSRRPVQCILISGLSGSGKSTVARMLSQQLGAVWLRADVERKKLFPDTTLRYSPAASQSTYLHLTNLARQLITAGYHVLIDATFQEQAHIDTFHAGIADLISPNGYLQLHCIVCQASTQTMHARIISRLAQDKDPSEATPAVLQEQQRRLSQAPPHWPMPLSIIHNEGSLEGLQAQLAHWLAQRRIKARNQP